jgi:hypothetical protein
LTDRGAWRGFGEVVGGAVVLAKSGVVSRCYVALGAGVATNTNAK